MPKDEESDGGETPVDTSLVPCPPIIGIIELPPLYRPPPKSSQSEMAYALSLGPNIELISGLKKATVCFGSFSLSMLLSEFWSIQLLQGFVSFKVVSMEFVFEAGSSVQLKDVRTAGFFVIRASGNVQMHSIPDFSLECGKLCSKIVFWRTRSFSFNEIPSIQIVISAFVDNPLITSLGRVQVKVELECS